MAVSNQEIFQPLHHYMHSQLPQDWPPSWTSKGLMHLALLVASRPARVDSPNHRSAVPFRNEKKNKFWNKLYGKKNTLFKKCLLIQIVLYRVCNFKISGILTSVFIMFLPSQVISCLFLNTVISIWYVLFSLWYCFCVFMTAYSRVIIFSTSQTVQTHIAKQRPYHWAKNTTIDRKQHAGFNTTRGQHQWKE